MELAKLSFDQIVLLIVFVVIPLLQKVFGALAEKRGKAEAKDRMRRRREGTLDAPAQSAQGSTGTAPGTTAEETTDEAEGKGAFWEWIAEQVGEGDEPPKRRGTSIEGPLEEAEDKDPWSDLVEEAKADEPEPFSPLAAGLPTDDDDAPRPVQPKSPERVRAASSQLSDFESVSVEGLSSLSAAPTEEQLERGLEEHAALADLDVLGDDSTLSGFEGSSSRFAGLGGLVDDATSTEERAQRASASARAKATGARDWRQAVILSEVLGQPVSLRDGGGYAPGLDR